MKKLAMKEALRKKLTKAGALALAAVVAEEMKKNA